MFDNVISFLHLHNYYDTLQANFCLLFCKLTWTNTQNFARATWICAGNFTIAQNPKTKSQQKKFARRKFTIKALYIFDDAMKIHEREWVCVNVQAICSKWVLIELLTSQKHNMLESNQAIPQLRTTDKRTLCVFEPSSSLLQFTILINWKTFLFSRKYVNLKCVFNA